MFSAIAHGYGSGFVRFADASRNVCCSYNVISYH